MQGMLILALMAFASFGIAIYSIQPRESTIGLPTTPAAAILPIPVPVSIDGVIVIGTSAASVAVPYVQYTDQGTVKMKRLAFRDRYGCTAGELPCASPVDTSYPLAEGDRVYVEGTADADVIYVERLTVNGRATLRSYGMEAS